MKMYNLSIGEGGMWGDGVVSFCEYTDINDFIDAAEYWLGADGGVFWKRSKYRGYSNKYTAKTWPTVRAKLYKEGLEYNNIKNHPHNMEPIRAAFESMSELVKERGYIIVPYGFEYGDDFLCIHKEDWAVLRNLRIKYDEWEGGHVVVR